MIFKTIFSERLKALRKSRKITQTELGEVLQLGKTSISMMEKGNSLPSFEVLVATANYFNVPIDYLLGRIDYTKGVTMELSNIAEIVELYDYRHVNRYIRDGWQLLAVASFNGDGVNDENSHVRYCLGWNKSLGKSIHPDPYEGYNRVEDLIDKN